MARNSGCCDIFSIDVGAGYRVRSIFVESKLLQGDVVERNTLETVVDSVSTIIVTLEFKVDDDDPNAKQRLGQTQNTATKRKETN